jgi:hypothetical protein
VRPCHQDKEIRGKYWEYSYHTTDDVSGLYILENYKAAALEKGGTILGEERERLVFTLPTPEGGTLWVEVYRNGWNTYYRLHIIEEQPLKKVLTFGAAQIRSELETKGEVTLHGVHFDFNKATLRPESEKVLVEAASVLQALPGMRVEIQGHTCDIGGRAYNLKLSQARAEPAGGPGLRHGCPGGLQRHRGRPGPEPPGGVQTPVSPAWEGPSRGPLGRTALSAPS